MLKFWVLFLLTLFLYSPVNAGELESAISNGNTLLYIGASWCGSCRMFNPIYSSLQKKYGSKYNFVKINADTLYGQNLSRKYNVRFIPYVALFKKNSYNGQMISSDCIHRYNCMDKVLEDFSQ